MIGYTFASFCFGLIIFIKLLASSHVEENEPDVIRNVNLTAGQVRGLLHRTSTGLEAYVFFGVPYVEPPLGDLRFAKAVPIKPWNGTLDCTGGYKPACPQNISISQYAHQSEDCLYINVFVSPRCLSSINSTIQTNDSTTDNSTSLCPVLYYVHGGANEFESPAMFPTDDLIDNIASQDIVLVTVAYRLGVLGFFSTGTDDVPGNWAVGDVIEGAKWVQREIENFGGSPTNITIMGHSSSATLVSLLTMTNKSEGLFDRAVVMSGSGTVWNAIWNDVSDYTALTRKVHCLGDDRDGQGMNQSQTILQCMRKIDPKILVNEFNKLRGYEDNGIMPVNITQVRNDGQDGYFPLPLKETIAQRRPMDLLTGTTKFEDGPEKWLVKRGSPLTTIRKCSRIVQQNANLKRKKRITKACIREYVSGVRPWEIFSRNRTTTDPFSFWTDQTVAVQEDAEYFAPCAKEVSTMLKASKGFGTKVFLYSFDYEKSKLKGIYPWHAADVSYILGSHKLDGKFNKRDLEVQKRYLPLFVNFIKFGDPTPTPIDGVRMPVLDSEHSKRPYPYLSVNIPLKIRRAYHSKADYFWNTIVPKLDDQKDFWPEEKNVLYPMNPDGTLMENFTWSELTGNASGTRDYKDSNASQYVKYDYGVTWPLYVIALLCFMMLIVPSSAYLMTVIRRRRLGQDEASRPLLRTSGRAVHDNYDAL